MPSDPWLSRAALVRAARESGKGARSPWRRLFPGREWTTDQCLPYNGFRVDMYAYMSTLQFGTHKTTRGGSFASSSSLVRSTYRQAYHPDRFDAFTGFRTCAAG